MKPGTVQQIFDEHFPAVDAMRPLDDRSRCAAWNICTCRTPRQGFHIDECPNGDYRIILSNSCKHRSCPMCGAMDTGPGELQALHRAVGKAWALKTRNLQKPKVPKR